MPAVRYAPIHLGGGLDLLTPTLSAPPGICRDALNFECSVTGGYTRAPGYERFDGRPSPSAATYTTLNITGSTSPALGVTITGGSSSAHGVLIAQTATKFILTKCSGVFTNGENLTSSGTVAVLTDYGAEANMKTGAQYRSSAADLYRADINKPTGSGAVRGVFVYNDLVYCFRDDAGATYNALYVSSSTGWTLVPFFKKISFTAGSVAPAEGTTLTQGGVTATVKRVVLQNGAWLGGTAVGIIVIDAVSGGHFSAGAATGGATLTISGAEVAISRLPGGKLDCDIYNFGGSSATKRVYGADGVNPAFEFDGTVYLPIYTGASVDTPKYAIAHRNHLMLTVGSSVLASAPGLPYDFTTGSSASEIAVGDTITGIITLPGTQSTAAMAVYTSSSTFVLYGTGYATWSLTPFNTGTGAMDYSAQNMAQTLVLDSRGVIDMGTTLNYGNFQQDTLTSNIRTFINERRSYLSCSTLNRDKSQYRIYYSDGYALFLTLVNGKFIGAMPQYYPISGGIYQAWECQFIDNTQKIFAAGSDGYVYQMDTGTSHDGAAITARLTLNYSALGNSRMLKRFRRASVEVQGSSYAEFDFSYLLGYSSASINQASPAAYSTSLSSVFWDSFTWDSFVWDGATISPSECEMTGTGENISLVFSSNNNYSDEFTLNSAIIHFTERRALR